MTDDRYVLVLDVEVLTPTRVLNHTIRPHEQDTVGETEAGDIRLAFGPRVDNDGRDVPSKIVLIPAAHIVEMTRSWRWELKVRVTPAELVNKQRAEVAALALKLGVAKPLPTS
jgi:hypothetical protein